VDLVIKFKTADLVAVAPVVAKTIIRTPMKSLAGKSNGDLVMWNDKRQAKVEALAKILVGGASTLPTDQGSIFATYVGAAAINAYLQLVESKMDPAAAAHLVNNAALKMVAGLRALAANQCAVRPVVAAPVAAKEVAPEVVVVAAETAVIVVDSATPVATTGEASVEPQGETAGKPEGK
jgi:hypothetical protein